MTEREEELQNKGNIAALIGIGIHTNKSPLVIQAIEAVEAVEQDLWTRMVIDSSADLFDITPIETVEHVGNSTELEIYYCQPSRTVIKVDKCHEWSVSEHMPTHNDDIWFSQDRAGYCRDISADVFTPISNRYIRHCGVSTNQPCVNFMNDSLNYAGPNSHGLKKVVRTASGPKGAHVRQYTPLGARDNMTELKLPLRIKQRKAADANTERMLKGFLYPESNQGDHQALLDLVKANLGETEDGRKLLYDTRVLKSSQNAVDQKDDTVTLTK
jgi:hypothetical protein